jgi:hypothetical protein
MDDYMKELLQIEISGLSDEELKIRMAARIVLGSTLESFREATKEMPPEQKQK